MKLGEGPARESTSVTGSQTAFIGNDTPYGYAAVPRNA